MDKKLTKKEIQELEKIKNEKLNLKYRIISNMQDYWHDISATERYAKINEKDELLNWQGHLIEEEAIKLRNRYENLKDLTDIEYQASRLLVFNYQNNNSARYEEHLPKDAVHIDEILWKKETLESYINFFKKLGIDKVYYTGSSTEALEFIVWMTQLGAKIIGTTKILEGKEGLIFQLEN